MAQSGLRRASLSTICLCTVLASQAPPKVPSSSLPPGEGRTVLERSCLSCHSLDTVLAHRDTRAGWSRTIAEMVSKGARISDDDRAILAEFLMTVRGRTEEGRDGGTPVTAKEAGDHTARAGDGPASQSSGEQGPRSGAGGGDRRGELPEGAGRAAVERSCSQCHSLEVAVSRHESRAGWVRVVEDMVSRGAEIPDEDAARIVQYLAQNFPANPAEERPAPTHAR